VAARFIESDETYIGRQAGQPPKAGPATKNIVLTLVERGGSTVASLSTARRSRTLLRSLRQTFATKTITTNTVEAYYSIFKRGMKGIYQHCSEKHLHRYLSEFDFRYSNRIALGVDDGERRMLAIKNAAGKRLTYRGRH
jgi:ISXO2 transposase-like protein